MEKYAMAIFAMMACHRSAPYRPSDDLPTSRGGGGGRKFAGISRPPSALPGRALSPSTDDEVVTDGGIDDVTGGGGGDGVAGLTKGAMM